MSDRTGEISRSVVRRPIGAVAAAVRGASEELQSKESAVRESKTEAVLEKYLGIKPSECKLSFVFFNHVIDDAIAKEIETKNIKIVLGEFSPTPLIVQAGNLEVKDYRKGTVMEKILNPNVGAEPEALAKDAAYTKQFISQGVSFIATDGELWSFQNSPIPFTAAMALNMGYTMALTFTAIKTVSDLKNTVDTQKFLSKWGIKQGISRRDVFKLGGALGSFFLLGKKITTGVNYVQPGNPDVQISWRAGGGISNSDTKLELEDVLLQPVFAEYGRGQITLRNAVMAQNTWNTIARSVRHDLNSGPLNILFSAGNGHGRAYGEFLKGPDELTQELKRWTDHLCNETLTYVLSEKSDLTATDAWQVFKDFAQIFSEPAVLGVYPMKATKATDPKSACDILLDSMHEGLDVRRVSPSAEDARKAKFLKDSIDFVIAKKELDANNLADKTYSVVANLGK